ncbi:MAG: hypothetical protein E4H14_10100 [Candidatus Thorarchaeota archaeon]|nr:MAG: hypothetical protein E4H14_10100 [Candidatus Thorarchaeota archaeon]
MSIHTRLFIVFIVTTILLIPIAMTDTVDRNPMEPFLKPSDFHKYEPVDYTIHDPINISSDQQFMDQALAEGWLGNGTEENPYVIEDFSINCETNCIEITNVESYFEIRDCMLSSPNESEELEYPLTFDYGIYIRNSSNAIIDSCFATRKYTAIGVREAQCEIYNNSCVGNRYRGISMYDSDNSTIINNVIERASTGISVSNSANTTIGSNNITSVRSYGIDIDCRFSIVRDNRIEDASMGIYIDWSFNNTYVYNHIRNCSYASLYIEDGYNHNISYNVFSGAGIYLSSWGGSQLWALEEYNNTVNGKLIYYARDQSFLDINPGDYGQVILYNCTESVVQGGTIADTNIAIQIGYCDTTVVRNTGVDNCSQYGISVASSDFSEIEYNTITNCYYGIMMQSSEYCSVLENTITDCLECSIYLGNANFGEYNRNEIAGARDASIGFSITNTETSTFQDNVLTQAGFKVDGHRLESWSHTMTNNMVNGKPLGYFNAVSDTEIDVSHYAQVILGGCDGVTIKNGYFENVPIGVEMGYSDNCIARNMTVLNCSWHGIHLRNTYSSLITNSTIKFSENDGIWFYFTFDSNVTSNIIVHNERYGIRLFASRDCKVFGNSIGWNILSNGNDHSSYNMWDDGISVGNSWSDYNGSGFYLISGTEDVFDHFPSIYTIPNTNSSLSTTTITNTTYTQTDTSPIDMFVAVGVIGIGIEVIIIVAIIFRGKKESID